MQDEVLGYGRAKLVRLCSFAHVELGALLV